MQEHSNNWFDIPSSSGTVTAHYSQCTFPGGSGVRHRSLGSGHLKSFVRPDDGTKRCLLLLMPKLARLKKKGGRAACAKLTLPLQQKEEGSHGALVQRESERAACSVHDDLMTQEPT